MPPSFSSTIVSAPQPSRRPAATREPAVRRQSVEDLNFDDVEVMSTTRPFDEDLDGPGLDRPPSTRPLSRESQLGLRPGSRGPPIGSRPVRRRAALWRGYADAASLHGLQGSRQSERPRSRENDPAVARPRSEQGVRTSTRRGLRSAWGTDVAAAAEFDLHEMFPGEDSAGGAPLSARSAAAQPESDCEAGAPVARIDRNRPPVLTQARPMHTRNAFARVLACAPRAHRAALYAHAVTELARCASACMCLRAHVPPRACASAVRERAPRTSSHFPAAGSSVPERDSARGAGRMRTRCRRPSRGLVWAATRADKRASALQGAVAAVQAAAPLRDAAERRQGRQAGFQNSLDLFCFRLRLVGGSRLPSVRSFDMRERGRAGGRADGWR
jgi:hypothetical protein